MQRFVARICRKPQNATLKNSHRNSLQNAQTGIGCKANGHREDSLHTPLFSLQEMIVQYQQRVLQADPSVTGVQLLLLTTKA